MKTYAVLLQIALLGLVGCSGQSTPVATPSTQSEATAVAVTEDNSAIATLVSLKVPNMH